MQSNLEQDKQESTTKRPPLEIFDVYAMEEGQNTIEPTKIVKDVHDKIKDLEDDAIQKNTIIADI